MIKIVIDHELSLKLPNLSLGIIQSQVKVSEYNENLWREINQHIAEISNKYTLESLCEIKNIEALKNSYKIIGKEPSRYRGSSEALLRRIIQGKGLYKINTVVDINNLISLESLHSVGSYDLDLIKQPMIFRIGKPNEVYKGIGKDMINIAELPVFADVIGPFGSPTSDSERAMITKNTKNLMMIIISFNGKNSLEKHLSRALELLVHYAEADKNQIKTLII